MRKRKRRNPTAYYDRYLPSDYARRLVSSHGLKKAEEMTARGSEKYGKTHAGWWPASYDTTQTIKHSGVYVKKNPKSKRRARYSMKRKRSARKIMQCLRSGKCRSKTGRKYLGIARASTRRAKKKSSR